MQINIELTWDIDSKEWQCFLIIEHTGGAIIQPTLKDVEDEVREMVDNLVELGEISGEYMDAPINWSVMEEEVESFNEYVKQASEEQKEELRLRKLL